MQDPRHFTETLRRGRLVSLITASLLVASCRQPEKTVPSGASSGEGATEHGGAPPPPASASPSDRTGEGASRARVDDATGAPETVNASHGRGDDADVDAAAAAPLDIRLLVSSPMYIGCHRNDIRGGDLVLGGELLITIANHSDRTVRFLSLDTEGLTFEPVRDGGPHKEFTLEHTCHCLGVLVNPMEHVVSLPPGASRTIHMEPPWMHGQEPFRAPPPGRYRMRYRVVMLGDPLRPDPEEPALRKSLKKPGACVERLTARLAAETSITSPPLPVTLNLHGSGKRCGL